MTTRSEIAPARPVGIALAGCGRISASHLDAIKAQPELGQLIAIVDTDLERAKEFAARYGAPYAFSDFSQLFEIGAVEAVIICTPNVFHESQTAIALSAGRHVLVEKPFSEDVAGAIRIAGIAERTGLILAVGHTFRHVDAVRYIQDHRSDFGRLRAINISMCVRWNGPQAPWWAERTPQEGLILSLFAPHALDFLQLAMGDDDPIRINVETARHQTGWKAEDEAMILLRYPHDVMASIHISYNQEFMVNRKTLHYEKAMVRLEDGDHLWIDDTLVVKPDGPITGNPHRLGDRDGSHYFRTQFREFVLAVRGKENRSVLHHDALRLTKLNCWIIEKATATQP